MGCLELEATKHAYLPWAEWCRSKNTCVFGPWRPQNRDLTCYTHQKTTLLLPGPPCPRVLRRAVWSVLICTRNFRGHSQLGGSQSDSTAPGPAYLPWAEWSVVICPRHFTWAERAEKKKMRVHVKYASDRSDASTQAPRHCIFHTGSVESRAFLRNCLPTRRTVQRDPW